MKEEAASGNSESNDMFCCSQRVCGVCGVGVGGCSLSVVKAIGSVSVDSRTGVILNSIKKIWPRNFRFDIITVCGTCHEAKCGIVGGTHFMYVLKCERRMNEYSPQFSIYINFIHTADTCVHTMMWTF